MAEKTEPESIPGLDPGEGFAERVILRPEKIELNGRDPNSLRTELTFSEGLAEWLHAHGVSIAFTAFNAGGLHLVGQDGSGRVTVVQNRADGAAGLAYNGRDLCVGMSASIRVYKNIRTSESLFEKIFDKLFVPRISYTISRLDVHELNFDRSGKLLFANTKYSCVAGLHPTHSFTSVWKPLFISKLLSEDRCHLNGMAFVDGELRYVSAFLASDDGWRGKATDKGVVIDTRANQIVAEGFIKPHSPRFHGGALWVLDSGRGQLVRIDLATGARDDVVFIPGFLKGLSFFGKYAVLTSSRLRKTTADYLELDESLKSRGLDAWCAVFIVDLDRREVVHWIRLDGLIREMADVLFLPDARCPWVGVLTSIGTPLRKPAAVSPQQSATVRRPVSVAAGPG